MMLVKMTVVVMIAIMTVGGSAGDRGEVSNFDGDNYCYGDDMSRGLVMVTEMIQVTVMDVITMSQKLHYRFSVIGMD